MCLVYLYGGNSEPSTPALFLLQDDIDHFLYILIIKGYIRTILLFILNRGNSGKCLRPQLAILNFSCCNYLLSYSRKGIIESQQLIRNLSQLTYNIVCIIKLHNILSIGKTKDKIRKQLGDSIRDKKLTWMHPLLIVVALS